jgi:hypothetical protein
MNEILFKFIAGTGVAAVTVSLAVYIALYLVFRHPSLRWLIGSHVLAAILAILDVIPHVMPMPLPAILSDFNRFDDFLQVAWALMLLVDLFGSIWFLAFLIRRVRRPAATPYSEPVVQPPQT